MAYFENLPLIRYSNTYSRNIVSRAALTEEVLKNTYVYYPYELKSDIRPELFANYYYDSSYFDWTVFLANSIIDPYYQWYLNDEQLNNLIESKHGSLINATSKIHHWEVNWFGDDTILSVPQYNSLIVDIEAGINQKKYWTPIFDDVDRVIGYKRKALDLSVDTNFLVDIIFSSTPSGSFVKGEKVYQVEDSVITAYGFVQYVDSTHMILKNINGTINNSFLIVGEESGVEASIDSSVVVSRSFPQQESMYWRSISVYEYEIDQNEMKKSINVIDKKYIADVDNALKQVFG